MSFLSCPNCRRESLKHYSDNVEGGGVYSCSECAGLWFDGHTLHEFLHSRRLKARFILDEFAEPQETFSIDTGTRLCPRCSKPVQEITYAGVTVDACRQCQGLWFDEGALGRVLKAHRDHKQRNAVLDEELAADAAAPEAHLDWQTQEWEKDPGFLPLHLNPDDVQHLKLAAGEAAHKVAGEVKHVFEAVAHFMHHDHEKK